MKTIILHFWWIIPGLIAIGIIIKGFINVSRNPMPESFRDARVERSIDRIPEIEYRKHKDYNNEEVDQNFLNGLPADEKNEAEHCRCPGFRLLMPLKNSEGEYAT